MLLSIFARTIGIIVSIVLFIIAVVSFIRYPKTNKTIIKPVIIFIFALSIPYFMFFYGQYRNNNLDLKNNLEDVISLIEKLDIKEYIEPYGIGDDGEQIYPGYECIGYYEAEIPYTFISISVLKADKRIEKKAFVSRSFISEVTQYDESKFLSKVESGETNGIYWTASPLVEYYEPTLYAHTGIYDGTFNISVNDIIYSCSYSISRNLPVSLIAFVSVSPRRITANNLIKMFVGVENMYEPEYQANS